MNSSATVNLKHYQLAALLVLFMTAFAAPLTIAFNIGTIITAFGASRAEAGFVMTIEASRFRSLPWSAPDHHKILSENTAVYRTDMCGDRQWLNHAGHGHTDHGRLQGLGRHWNWDSGLFGNGHRSPNPQS